MPKGIKGCVHSTEKQCSECRKATRRNYYERELTTDHGVMLLRQRNLSRPSQLFNGAVPASARGYR